MKYYYYWLAIFVFAVDYLSKKWIEHSLTLDEMKPVLGDFFVITSVRNKGAAFSILQNQRIFFVAITIIVIVGIVWYITRIRNSGKILLLSGLGMVLGGALGNFLERALYGEVVDFLQFTFGSYVFPIFNLADSGIFVGVVLILLDAFITSKNENGDPNDRQERNGQDELNGQQGNQFIG
ncbi:signal peptidase II [Paenibacillus sp. OV219]|uniref:signal peptidase II n=1 Tax=Paenibacillus sp. OV219 TaxID=1884377 RepID=UPI0008B17D04|nr:signal peptidase II [Paenibacillus sp. OV219]SEN13176.1 signal peptidase II Aspartic peptidase. MEROPS family A08 [Paenibacillus sp. OV219]